MKEFVRMKWTGASPTRVLELPVPLLFKHEKTGEILFDPEADVPIEVADALDTLLGSDSPFIRVNGAGRIIIPDAPNTTALWKGKETCQTYINEHGIKNAKPKSVGFGRFKIQITEAVPA